MTQRMLHGGARVVGGILRDAPSLGTPGQSFVAREEDGSFTLWVERPGTGHERLGTVPLLTSLSAMPASQAASASNLAPVYNDTTDRVETSRFDVLMGALAELGGYYIVTNPKYGGGADATGATDSIAAMNAAAAAATNGVIIVPPGATVRIDSTFALPATVSLLVLGTLKAGAAMTALVQTPLATLASNQHIAGDGFLDGNNLADWGIQIRYAAHYEVHDVAISGTRLGYVKAGDTGSSSNSFEVMLRNVHGLRSGSQTVVAGSQGFWFANASDSSASGCVAVGMETGFRVDTSHNQFTDCHAWSDSRTVGWTVTCFDDNGNGNAWTACFADTPQTYGFRCRQTNARLVGCTVFNNTLYGQDNVIVGVRFDQASPFSSVIGLYTHAGSGAHAILADIQVSGDNLSTLFISGQQASGTVTTTTRDHARGWNAEKLRVGSDEAGTDLIQIKDYSQTLTPASVPATTAPVEQTFTVTGLLTTDRIILNGPAPTAGVGIGNVRASAADTLAIQFINPTGGSVTPTSGSYKILALRIG